MGCWGNKLNISITAGYYIDGEFLVSFLDLPINENPDWQGFGEFGAPWNEQRPWGNKEMAPFDEKVNQIIIIITESKLKFTSV